MNKVKTALVTGGRTGIGAAITKAFLDSNIQCTVTATSPERPNNLSAEVKYLPLNFHKTESIARALAHIREELKPDILVNNAGFNRKSDILDYDPNTFQEMFEANLKGAFQASQAALPAMIDRGWGRIVNITSVWSVLGNARNTAYCATKFGLDGLTAALSTEVARHGVLVNGVGPGYTLTEAIRKKYSKADLASTNRFIPVGRMARPEEIAELVLWLTSTANTYVTGQNIQIDGGLSRAAQPILGFD